MEEEAQPTLFDQLFDALEQLLLPNWSDLIRLLPWVIIALVLAFLVFTAWQWRRAGARNASRVPPPRAGGTPPPGVHLPGPSRWPFVLPIGAALLLFAIALPSPGSFVNVPLLVAGAIVSLIGIVGWLIDAMREWRSTATADAHGAAMLQAHALAPGASPALLGGGTAAAATFVEPPEPPVGVHMPGPSPWPFLAPIAMAVMLFGLVFSAVLIVAGVILGIISAAGWLIDAGREYKSTEAVGHAVPATRDPEKVWPRKLVPVFGGVIVIAVLITLAPVGLTWLNSLTPAEASPTPVAVPAVPEIAASSATSFETNQLIVPAGRPFDLIFHNNDEGVPHNVEIAEGPARATVYLDGEVVNGVTTVTYQVPELAEGDYYFLCKIHINMNGSVKALPETGAAPPPGGGPAPGASPGQASPQP